MTLHKVKETLINDKKSPTPLPYEREFDIVVKIEEVNRSNHTSSIKVTDSSNLLFEIELPSYLINDKIGQNDVIRVNKLR